MQAREDSKEFEDRQRLPSSLQPELIVVDLAVGVAAVGLIIPNDAAVVSASHPYGTMSEDPMSCHRRLPATSKGAPAGLDSLLTAESACVVMVDRRA